ncbi:MAG: hypothetical protein Greene041679_687 [Parcubacteria group bacterium Greene0416_79]|nr:MAG: hypothetical protein Greene041679_687 [Parcubacteria group bacterium Greene0416_79]
MPELLHESFESLNARARDTLNTKSFSIRANLQNLIHSGQGKRVKSMQTEIAKLQGLFEGFGFNLKECCNPPKETVLQLPLK